MLLRAAICLACLALPAETAPGVCVTNGTPRAALFVAEANGAAQVTGTLAPTETLCSGAGTSPGGVVRVFEHADAFEGCSRLVPEGETEILIRYAEFDRCHWSSHDR